jgi:hypothetical protein
MLIKNEAEFKKVMGGVQQNITWQTMEPFVRAAELEYIVADIGEELYDELDEVMNPNTYQSKLIGRLQIVAGNYAFANSLSQMLLSVGDMGAVMNVPQGTMAVPKWTYMEAKKDAVSRAEIALEKAIVWLEKNSKIEVDGVSVFQTWKDSDAFTVNNELFLSSATEFTDFFSPLRQSRRMFMKLKNFVKDSERFYLTKYLPRNFLTALKNRTEADDITDNEREAIELLCYALANDSISRCLPFVNLTEDFQLISPGIGVAVQKEDNLDTKRRDELKSTCDRNAEQYMNKLRRFLDDTASETVFAEYFASDIYTNSKASKSYHRVKNDPSKPYVIL